MNNLGPVLKNLVERVESLEAEKQTYIEDIRDVYKEAEGQGLDVKALRAVIKLRKQDKAERAAFEAVLDEYVAALGLID